MTEQERNDLKAAIQQRMAQLHEQLAQHRSLSEQCHQQGDDESATLDITINATVEEQLTDNAQHDLLTLRRTLAWLDSDEAGLCDQCGEPIPVARLAAVPGTRTCVACAEQQGR